MFNPFYKINLFYTQKDLFEYAQENNHSFIFTVENPSLSKDGKRTYLFGSSLNAGTFLTTYNKCEHKHFYEMITDNIPIYEYYDLDLKITKESKYTNEYLITWFNNLRNEFIKINYPSYEKPTEFVITTASNEKKLSLHILNRNLIFNNKESLKVWYNSLKEFVYTFYDNDPLKESLDFSVCSNNRTMRIVNSTKFDQPERPLRFYNEGYYPINTLITTAQNDLSLQDKLITLCKEEKSIIKVTKNINPSFELSSIPELLSLLSPNRAGDYNDWIKVGWALKSTNDNTLLDIFKEWSKDNANTKNSKRCEDLWNSYTHRENNVSLGTIHYFAKLDNPIEYNKFIQKHKNFKVNFPFTPDIKINQKYIHENVYIDNLKTHDIISLKSNMNTGKTFCLPHLFNDYKVKVVVYFRISLNVSIFNKWKELGFELYSNIKESIIKTELHNNIIIQVDSLHRIQGKVDLLILDELESTHEHICSSDYINKNLEYTSLRNMIKNTPKIIACDANLKDETINVFFRGNLKRSGKNVIKIENIYHSFSNLSCKFFFDNTVVIQKVFDLLSSNKNIVIPTNSKNMANKLFSIITKKFPSIKILKMDSDTSFVDISEWSNYNVVIYTPKIVAGISFDEIHFHSVVAFFINKSCNAEPSSQMLFRVRNLIDNDMFIYTPHNVKERYLPIDDEEIFSQLNNVLKEGKISLDNSGLKLDKFNEKVIKDEYYLIFKSYKKKKNISRQYFYSYLRSILTNHGIKLSYDEYICPNTIKETIREDIKQSNIELKLEEANKIANAPIISPDELMSILDIPELLRSEDNTYSIKRYNLIDSFDLPIYTKVSTDWVVKHIPYVKCYRNYKQFSTFSTIDECVTFAIKLHEEKYNRDMLQSQNVDMSSSSEDSGYEGDTDNVIKKKKIGIKKIMCHALTYDSKYLKMKMCLQFIKQAGFKSITHKGRIKLDWKGLYNFIYCENKNISDIFESKPFKFITKEFDPEDGIKKKVMIEFVNRRLEDWFGLKISRIHKESNEYILEVLFKNILENDNYG